MSTETTERKLVNVSIYGTEDQLQYTGRCLGLLTPKEYCGLVNDKSLWTRLFTVPTKTLAAISELDDIEGLRLAIAVKKKGENEEEVLRKMLFITEPLDLISQIVGKEEITFVGKDGSYILATEEAE